MNQTRELVREYLQANNLTRSELERRAGIASSVVGHFLRGKRNLGQKSFKRLARFIDFRAEHHAELRAARAAHDRARAEAGRSGLFAAIMAEPAPCDSCWRVAQCRQMNQACEAYLVYTKNGRGWERIERRPSRELLAEAMAA